MADKQLPTRETAIAVRPESIPTPIGKSEKRELRSVSSKTFLHAEKAPDGKEIRTCQVQLGAVCYRDDNGEMRSIDTTVRDLDGEIGVDWAPYRFRLDSTGVGFDFASREGGQVSIKLTGIGGDRLDDQAALKPDIADNTITFRDVRPGCDIVFRCLNDRVKTLRILHDAAAPRTFEWSCKADNPELIDSTLIGTDAAGKALDLTVTVDGDMITETWTGGDVAYPVEIDPTVTVNPGVTADDGSEVATTWSAASIRLGSNSGLNYHVGLRYPGVAVAQGVVPSVATLGMNSAAVNGTGGAGTIYGRAADNPAAFSTGASLPSAVSKTTASTAVAAVGTTGAKSWDVTGIVTEILARGGWASGNAMAFPIIGSGTGTNDTQFSDTSSGANFPSLAITYVVYETGDGSASFTLTVSGVGLADATGNGAASHTYTVSGVGSADAIGVGAGAFTVTASGVGAADMTGSGASSHSFAVVAVGAADAIGSGAASCTVTVVAAALADATGAGASSHSFAVTGSGLANASGDGAVSFTVTASGAGAADAVASGSSSHSMTVSGIGAADAIASGSSAMTVTTAATASAFAIGSGSVSFEMAVAGIGMAATTAGRLLRMRRLVAAG